MAHRGRGAPRLGGRPNHTVAVIGLTAFLGRRGTECRTVEHDQPSHARERYLPNSANIFPLTLHPSLGPPNPRWQRRPFANHLYIFAPLRSAHAPLVRRAAPTSLASLSIDIPGLSVKIPYINVNAGIVLDVSVGGNAESLSLKVGIDACAQLPVVGKQCGSKLTSDLPIWLIKETYAFGSLCKSADNQGTPPALRASAASIA